MNIEKRSSEFRSLEKITNPDNSIYKYKTKGRSPKNFRNYQSRIALFKDVRDGNMNTKVVGEIRSRWNKKGNPKSKSKDQVSVMQIVDNCLDLRERFIDFF